jgi:hypothetical protein
MKNPSEILSAIKGFVQGQRAFYFFVLHSRIVNVSWELLSHPRAKRLGLRGNLLFVEGSKKINSLDFSLLRFFVLRQRNEVGLRAKPYSIATK